MDCTWKTALFLVFRILIEPTPKKYLISSNTAISLLCNSIAKIGFIIHPVLLLLLLVILILKLDSASEKPVTQ